MSFGIIGRTGPGMRQIVGFGDRSTRRDTFGANLGRAAVINVDVFSRRLGPFPNYFGQTCYLRDRPSAHKWDRLTV